MNLFLETFDQYRGRPTKIRLVRYIHYEKQRKADTYETKGNEIGVINGQPFKSGYFILEQ